MTGKQTFECHKIAPGKAQGQALVSRDDICFYLVAPETGVIIEEGHQACGQSLAGKVLVCPSGKGSSVVQADGLYQLQMHGNEPRAIIIRYPDTVLVATAIVTGTPLVDGLSEDFYDLVKTGDRVEVDADRGRVTVIKK